MRYDNLTTYDSLGRVTQRSQTRGTNTPRNDVFGYNSRSELTLATLGNDNYAYAFDHIGKVTATETIANPLQFSSEVYDAELDLVYYNYRHYSPSLGRFLSRDPIEEQGGLNLYAFVGNMTIIISDYLGFDKYVFNGNYLCRISDDESKCYKCWKAVSGKVTECEKVVNC